MIEEPLVSVLSRARDVGFLGPGPVVDHIEHAAVFGAAIDTLVGSDGAIADIGAGGGVPSLPMLVERPALSAVLIDASQKRCSFLTWAVGELGMEDRVEVWCERAETLGHQARARFRFGAVVARGFGPPASTTECGAALLAEGGHLVISEPPDRRPWPSELLAEQLGLRYDLEDQTFPGVATFARRAPLAERFPRRAKQLQTKPLFLFD